MGYKSYASLEISLSIFALPTMADVMDEYRDPSFTGGYVVGEYLFDETSEQDQKSLSIYGEYDVSAYATLYYRAQQAKIENKTVNGQVPDKAKDTDHISAFGTRLRYRFGEDDQHEIGTLLTLSQRDFNEINGLTYRVMPYIYLFSGRTFSARAHVEWDFIERDAWNAEVEDHLRIKTKTARPACICAPTSPTSSAMSAMICNPIAGQYPMRISWPQILMKMPGVFRMNIPCHLTMKMAGR